MQFSEVLLPSKEFFVEGALSRCYALSCHNIYGRLGEIVDQSIFRSRRFEETFRKPQDCMETLGKGQQIHRNATLL